MPVIKLGNVVIPVDKVKEIINELEPNSKIDYPNDIKTLDTGRHNAEELANYLKYTPDKLENYKYSDPRLTNLFPDEFLTNKGFDTTVKRVFVLVQPPGSFVAPHYDQFSMSKIVNKPISRLWVALEDSKFGQVMFVEQQTLSEFSSGDVFTFDNAALHSTANAGLHNRYTMIVYTTPITNKE